MHSREKFMKGEKKEKKREGKGLTVILILLFFVGLSVLCYPAISNWWNSKTMSRVVATYDEAVSSLDEADYSEYFEAAYAFNEIVSSAGSLSAITNSEQFEDYYDILDITGTGIMGYVTIEKIDVQLPIYHGTGSAVLSSGAGHLEGTSLPVGGESTHAVISAHRGLPSSTLFTNLNELEIGDTFTITVLNQVLTYQVDQITTVLPEEIEDLYIEKGQDYVTLMTCTPYGINTHRLLVRGTRIETAKSTYVRVAAEAYRLDPVLVAVFIAIPILAVLFIGVLAGSKRKKRNDSGGSRYDI